MAETKLKSQAVNGTIVTTRLESKVIGVTRDLAAVTGDVAYTGVGFQPTAIVGIASLGSGFSFSIGVVSSDKSDGNITQYQADNIATTGNFIEINTGPGNYQGAIVKTFDADGFTLTWTKSGSPTGTAYLTLLCFR